ncbi:MAG TPA: alpha/beta fold hydrolase [Nevskiaceae bacterium]
MGLSPKNTIWREGPAELWHYRSNRLRYPFPLLIVFSLISRSYILDLVPGDSFIERLVAAGIDVYMVDWGVPTSSEADHDLDHYACRMIPELVDAVRRDSGSARINLLGYCFGGVLALLHAADRPDTPVNHLVLMACPVDFRLLGPMSELFGAVDLDPDALLGPDGNVPPEVIACGFESPAPRGDGGDYAGLWQKLWAGPDAVAYQAIGRWAVDHIPFPGAAMRQTIRMLFRDNGLMTDRLTARGRSIHLSDIRTPLLAVLGTRDRITPEAAAAPIAGLTGSRDVELLRLERGHIGLIAGRGAARTSMPAILERLTARSCGIGA